jgi:hypothetical protein
MLGNMNKLSLTIRKILIGFSLTVFFVPGLTFAAIEQSTNPNGANYRPPVDNTDDGKVTQPSTTQSTDGTVTETELFYNFNYKGVNSSTTKIGAVNRIVSTKTWQQVLADVIKILLNISGALALLALTLSGVMMISARGKTDAFDKGKKILGYALAGLVIIAVSYAIVVGVSDLQFFTPGAGGGTVSNNAPASTPQQPTTDEGKTTTPTSR